MATQKTKNPNSSAHSNSGWIPSMPPPAYFVSAEAWHIRINCSPVMHMTAQAPNPACGDFLAACHNHLPPCFLPSPPLFPHLLPTHLLPFHRHLPASNQALQNQYGLLRRLWISKQLVREVSCSMRIAASSFGKLLMMYGVGRAASACFPCDVLHLRHVLR